MCSQNTGSLIANAFNDRSQRTAAQGLQWLRAIVPLMWTVRFHFLSLSLLFSSLLALNDCKANGVASCTWLQLYYIFKGPPTFSPFTMLPDDNARARSENCSDAHPSLIPFLPLFARRSNHSFFSSLAPWSLFLPLQLLDWTVRVLFAVGRLQVLSGHR